MHQLGKALITGGAGFIGGHLARRLARLPSAAIAVIDDLSRRGLEGGPNLPENIAFYRADICDPAALRQAASGVDTIYHLAAVSSVGAAQSDFGRAYEVNVQGTEAVLRAARECGVRRVVFASSREVYGEPVDLPVKETAPLRPRSAYGLTKASGESCCRMAAGIEVVVLRLANVYGAGDHGRVIPIFLRNAFLDQPLALYGGEQILDFIWIDDVVESLIRAAEASVVTPLNIGSGVGISLSELARLIVDQTGSRSRIDFLPRKTFEVMRFVADCNAARSVLNLEPISRPLVHLRELAEWTKREMLSAKAIIA